MLRALVVEVAKQNQRVVLGVLFSIVAWIGVIAALVHWGVFSNGSSTARYWLTDQPTRDRPLGKDEVVVWVSAHGDHKDCEVQHATQPEALSEWYVLGQEVEQHLVHYHLHSDDGLILREYVIDGDGEERALDQPLHYHGMVLPADLAAKVIAAVRSHQHGASEAARNGGTPS